MNVIDFRTELYRLRLPFYKVASEIGVHPSRLSLYLNNRLPAPPAVIKRLEDIITRELKRQGLSTDCNGVE